MIWTRLYDPHRRPCHWTGIVRRDQCVVLICDARSQAPRDADGRPFRVIVGRRRGIVRGYGGGAQFRAALSRHPELCSEIYDSEGKSGRRWKV